MDARRQKAHDLAGRARITFADGCYTVPSQGGNGRYTVILDERESLCDCPDFELRGEPGKPCKHILACRLWRGVVQESGGKKRACRYLDRTGGNPSGPVFASRGEPSC